MLHMAVCTSMQVGKKVKKNYSWETKVFIKATQRKVFPGHQEQEQCSKLGVTHVQQPYRPILATSLQRPLTLYLHPTGGYCEKLQLYTTSGCH